MVTHALRLIEDIDETLPDAPFARPSGSLLILAGLPGSGKSYLVRSLQVLVPCVVVSTDRVRLYARGRPTYTAEEMVYMYEVCYGLIERRLERGQRVVFDGSNYLQARRRYLLELAGRIGAPAALAHVQASEEVTRQRLEQRMSSPVKGNDLSDAGWSVYLWMVEAQEPIAMPHLTLDSTSTPANLLAQQLRDYWMTCETAFGKTADHL